MAPVKPRDKSSDPVVRDFMARYEDAWAFTWPHFQRMERLQKAYYNKINTLQWPTISEIAFPLTFIQVEEQLPLAMKMMFPESSRFIELIPVSEAMERDRVQSVEDSLSYSVTTQMSMEQIAYLSVKDCFKYGVGYGLIDTEYVSPPELATNTLIGSSGEALASTQSFRFGEAIQVPVYRYIPPNCVVTTRHGSSPDGPCRTDHFVLHLMHESDFLALYENKDADGRPVYAGDPKKIIDDARKLKFHTPLLETDALKLLAGVELARTSNPNDKSPVMIPVLRCYSDRHQVWIANGTDKIWECKDKYQTLMSDLVKWSAWPDGLNWFPMSIAEASESLNMGVNIWYNGLVDLSMYLMNPSRIVNTRMMDNPNSIPRGPRADLKVNGDVRQAAAYMNLPEFPGQLFQMGDILQRFQGQTSANPSFLNGVSPGFVRGGSNALEMLLQSSNGRQYLAACILKTGGLLPAIEKTLIKKQLLVQEEGERFIRPSYDAATGKKLYEASTVTQADMRRIFKVKLNLPFKGGNQMAAEQKKMAFFDRARQDAELFDKRALYSEVFGDDDMVRRTMLPESVVAERQNRMAEARMATAEAGAEEAAPAGEVPMSVPEQALSGAMMGGEE